MFDSSLVFASGVVSGRFLVRVLDGQSELEVVLNWEKPLQDLKMIHCKWLASDTESIYLFHPKGLGFEAPWSPRRTGTRCHSSLRHVLHFPWWSQRIYFGRTTWAVSDDDAQIIYFTLRAMEENYRQKYDEKASSSRRGRQLLHMVVLLSIQVIF